MAHCPRPGDNGSAVTQRRVLIWCHVPSPRSHHGWLDSMDSYLISGSGCRAASCPPAVIWSMVITFLLRCVSMVPATRQHPGHTRQSASRTGDILVITRTLSWSPQPSACVGTHTNHRAEIIQILIRSADVSITATFSRPIMRDLVKTNFVTTRKWGERRSITAPGGWPPAPDTLIICIDEVFTLVLDNFDIDVRRFHSNWRRSHCHCKILLSFSISCRKRSGHLPSCTAIDINRKTEQHISD